MNSHLPEIWKSVDSIYTVEIAPACLQAMLDLANEHSPNEIGTALIGCYSSDHTQAKILELAPIAPDSAGRRMSYVRGAAGLRTFFRTIFMKSKGERYYVGEWHSHPGGVPFPSGTDDQNVFDVARDPKECCPECILIIISTGVDIGIGVFVYSRLHGKTTLRPI